MSKSLAETASSGSHAPGREVEEALAADLPAQVVSNIESVAHAHVARLMAAEPGSAAFHRAVAAVDTIGEREVRTTTQIVAAFHDRPTATLSAVLADRSPLARNLGQLRRAADELAREATIRRSATGLGDAVWRIDNQVREVLPAIEADRQVLERDNASLTQQERALGNEIRVLRQYVALAARLDDLIEDEIEVSAAAQSSRAELLRHDALYAVRRRHRDLLLQLTTATQAYLTLRLVERDNLEVIWSVRAATTTTVTALRTALMAIDAVASRERPSIDALRDTADAWSTAARAIEDVETRRRKTLVDAATAGRASG